MCVGVPNRALRYRGLIFPELLHGTEVLEFRAHDRFPEYFYILEGAEPVLRSLTVIVSEQLLCLGADPLDFIGHHALAHAPVRLTGVPAHREMWTFLVGWWHAREIDALRVERPEQRCFDLARMVARAPAILVESGLIGFKIRQAVEPRTHVPVRPETSAPIAPLASSCPFCNPWQIPIINIFLNHQYYRTSPAVCS